MFPGLDRESKQMETAMRLSTRARGFTLIELLVVIAIISVLVGLLLPAINAARESGRRAQCQSNMRNIGLGILGYANVFNKFPPLGVISDDPLKKNPPRPPIEVPRNQGIVSWLDPALTPDELEVPMYNWVVEILPYIDQQDLYNGWTKVGPAASGGGTASFSYLSTDTVTPGEPSNYTISSTAVAVLRCPDDVTAQPGQGNLSYVANAGFSLWTALPVGWIGSPIDGNGGATTYDYSGMRWASPSQGWGAM
jgi:prepilin-type N-terminal cleavage/methylation domain-containing protein